MSMTGQICGEKEHRQTLGQCARGVRCSVCDIILACAPGRSWGSVLLACYFARRNNMREAVLGRLCVRGAGRCKRARTLTSLRHPSKNTMRRMSRPPAHAMAKARPAVSAASLNMNTTMKVTRESRMSLRSRRHHTARQGQRSLTEPFTVAHWHLPLLGYACRCAVLLAGWAQGRKEGLSNFCETLPNTLTLRPSHHRGRGTPH